MSFSLAASASITQHGAVDKPRWQAPLAAAVLAIIVYAVTLRGTYIYDDVAVIRADSRVLNVNQWGKLWTKPYFVNSIDKLYRPLVSMSFAIENYLHGDRPWIFHLVNVLLHAGAAAMVALLGLRLGGQIVAWISGLLFAVHPVHVEVVAGLVGRAESACALVTLAAICLFLRPGDIRIGRALGIWICFVMALLSKEQGILLPALLAAALPLRYRNGFSSADRQQLKYLAVLLCWTLAAYFIWREHVASLDFDRNRIDWIVNPLVRSHGWDRILMPFVLLGRYTGLLVFPMHLAIDYGAWTIGWHAAAGDPFLYVGIGAFLIWCLATAISWRRRNFAMLFCLLALALSYGMIGNVVALIGTIFGERLIYLPSAFFLLVVAMALSALNRRVVNTFLVAALVLGSVRTFVYAREWNDAVPFYREMIRVHPRSERPYALLWTWYQERGEWAAPVDRIRAFRRALDVAIKARKTLPDRHEPYVMYIQSELGLEDLNAADAAADEAISRLDKLDRARFAIWKDFIARRRRALGK